MTYTDKEFKGDCFGVEVYTRNEEDKAKMLKFLIEDDDSWIVKLTINAYWLDETIEILQLTRNYLKNNCRQDAWGYYDLN
jgi:hypothetical protein